nr:immunoglobulin heavy chain junction region [Mus musculus]
CARKDYYGSTSFDYW